MKTSELRGAALDWAVATAEGAYVPSIHTDADGTRYVNYGGMFPEWSTDWAQGGPIIERDGIGLRKSGDEWFSEIWADNSGMAKNPKQRFQHNRYALGPTPLIAAMRCYVASKLGDEVEIPEGLQ